MNPEPGVLIMLPVDVFEHLQNVLTWAALWDITENHDKNHAIYEQLLRYLVDRVPEGTAT